MKRVTLFKSAFDFAFASIATPEGVDLDAAIVKQFSDEKLDPLDYQYWKNSFIQARSNLKNLSNQLAPSATAAAQAKKA